MLVLCSNGLSSEKLLLAVKRELLNAKTAALVVTADFEYKEKNYHVARCINELKTLGLAVEIFDLDQQPVDLLCSYDVVEFIGGNPYYLLHSIRENNAVSVIKEIAANKVLIGWSAAAFVFSPSLRLVDCYSAEMNFVKLTDLSALALTTVEVLPHYSKFLKRFLQFEEKCSLYEKRENVSVIRLEDGEGVLVEGENFEIIRL